MRLLLIVSKFSWFCVLRLIYFCKKFVRWTCSFDLGNIPFFLFVSVSPCNLRADCRLSTRKKRLERVQCKYREAELRVCDCSGAWFYFMFSMSACDAGALCACNWAYTHTVRLHLNAIQSEPDGRMRAVLVRYLSDGFVRSPLVWQRCWNSHASV